MDCIELLERGIKQLQQEKGALIAEKSALVGRIHVLELALARMVKGQCLPPERDPVLGPELPNGEGIDYATGDGPPPHRGFTQGEPWKAKIGRVERHTESSGA